MMCLISVLMTTYNGEKYINEAIDSILDQTFEDYEFIIIDDCSTDNTARIIQKYTDKRIIFHKNEKNMGCVNSLNKGIMLAKGKYIAKFDQDDISYSERLQCQLDYMESHSNCVLLGTGVDVIIDGKVRDNNGISQYTRTQEELLFSMIFGNFTFPHSSFFLRRDTLINNNIYYETENCDDYDLIVRLSRVGDINKIKEPLVAYRIHSDQLSDRLGYANSMELSDLVREKVVEKYRLTTNKYLCRGIYRSLISFKDYVLFNKEYRVLATKMNITNRKLIKAIRNHVLVTQKRSLVLFLANIYINKNPFSMLSLSLLYRLLWHKNQEYVAPSELIYNKYCL